MFSDSTSDSDCGIRFKTTSTRHIVEKRTSEPAEPSSTRGTRRSSKTRDQWDDRPKGNGRHRRDDNRSNDNRNSDNRNNDNRNNDNRNNDNRNNDNRNNDNRNNDNRNNDNRHNDNRHNDNRHNDNRNNDNRINDRRPRRHYDRKSSPEYSQRSTKDDKTNYRNPDRSRFRQDSKRYRSRSPLNRNGRRRSISGDRKHGRRELADSKTSSTLDLKSHRDKYNDRHRVDNTGQKTNSDRSIVKENNNKSRLIINEKVEDTDGKKVNISDNKKKHVRENDLVRSSNDGFKHRESIKDSPKKHESSEKQIHATEHKTVLEDGTVKDNLLSKNSKGKALVTGIRNDGSETINDRQDQTNSKDEKSGKDKTKKLKHSKRNKKSKKEKPDLSEGELTPSDYDVSFNESELDKTSPDRKSIKSNVDAACRPVIGPDIPNELRGVLGQASGDVIELSDTGHVSTDEDTFGPLPSSCAKITKAHLDLEERAIKMRMDKLQQHDAKEEKNRDEWMLELPDVQAPHLGLGPRKFRAKEGPDMSDRSSWTDTPLTKGTKSKETESQASKRIAEEAHRLRIQEKDAKQEKLIKKHKKKHKREESLLDLHQKKLMKKKKKEKDAGASTERRRFDRDIDLGVNRFDDAQKKSIIKKAQLLDTRFSQGESKFL